MGCKALGHALVTALVMIGLSTGSLAAQQADPPPEVRQIVTFLFQPGRTGDAYAIYEQQLKQIYTDIRALRSFRAYREVESPEPLDLVVVSSYRGMAGMDTANDALRRTQHNGQSALVLYGVLSGMTQSHHDQFAEMIPDVSDAAQPGGLTVFQYLRLVPGAHAAFETLLRSQVRPFEKANASDLWSESGRLLVSDGWDYVRIFGIRSLGDWQAYLTRLRDAPFAGKYGGLVSAQKTIVLRNDPRLSVR